MKLFSRHSFKGFICSLIILILLLHSATAIYAEEKTARLENDVEEFINQNMDHLAGLSTIIVDNDRIISIMKGYADIENQLSVDEDTIFEWGSVTKILIWISIFQLVESGELDLSTDIHHYLPNDFKFPQKHKEPVTLWHLMNHTAGFDDRYTDLMVESPMENMTLRASLEQATIEQVFSPGDIVSYSNYGSALAAYIVENVSGQDYKDYVHQNIFKPLNMTKTAIHPNQEDQLWVKDQRKRVQGYSNSLQLIERNIYSIPMYPAGSVMGTAGDLQRLLQALMDKDGKGLFKHKQTIDTLFEPSLFYPETTIPRIANGFFYLPSKSKFVFGHGGNSKAFSSTIYINRHEHIGVLVLTNVKNEQTFTSGIPEIIFGPFSYELDPYNLENANQWNGIYEPARIARGGFSRIYGLFLRSQTKAEGNNELTINEWNYKQLNPGIYRTDDSSSLYSLDIYSKHPAYKKLLSNTSSDLLYVPYYKHLLEWGGVIFAIISLLYSLSFLITTTIKLMRMKKKFCPLVFTQHVLNLLVWTNMCWIIFHTISMVRYDFLKPYLTFNLVYIFLTILNILLLMSQFRRYSKQKNHSRSMMLTVLTGIIISCNIIYWEFYF